MTAIIYYSNHHGNTKKLLDAIALKNPEVTLIDVVKTQEYDLNRFDRIGFASGIYYGKFAEQLLNFAKVNLPVEKNVFLLATAGNPRKSDFKAMEKIVEEKDGQILGEYQCKGFDTFGPFKLLGGIQKGHPTEVEIQAAVDFYSTCMQMEKKRA